MGKKIKRMGISRLIRTMSNKELLYDYNKIRREQQLKRETGSYYTSSRQRLATSEFWGREGIKQIKKEIERRKRLGLLHKSAGKPKRKTNQTNYWGLFGGNGGLLGGI